MMRFLRSAAGLSAGAALLVAAASASASPAYVVHGIPGVDLGADPALPVDIKVDGACTLEGAEFGQVAGPVELPAGPKQIRMSLADATAPCDGAPAVTARVDVSIAETAILIAHLDQNGAPTVSRFTADAGPTDPHNGRLAVVHTARAPAVDLDISRVGREHPIATIEDLRPGDASFGADLPARMYDIAVAAAGEEDPLAVVPFTLEAGISYVVFAVGSLANQTFAVIPVDIDTSPES
jgi:hypothetical protein